MNDSTRRFSTRVDNYMKYRPHYPPEVLCVLQKGCGLISEWQVADVGSGTGFLTELFLENANTTYGIEPNKSMREAAEAHLSEYPSFISIDGTAEATKLPDSSVEMVVAGQSFHWFDREKAKREFLRILRPGGWVVLIWNERRIDATPFLADYERLLKKFSIDYAEVDHRQIDEAVLREFFSPSSYETHICGNVQSFDFTGAKGRLLSSSYAPEPGQPNYDPMIAELARAYAAHQQHDRVLFVYNTAIHFGQLR